MTLNKLLILPVIIGTLVTSGCTTLKEIFLTDITKEECERTQWYEVGEKAVLNGYENNRFYEMQKQCNKYFNIFVSSKLQQSFNEGYQQGIKQYCTNTYIYNYGTDCKSLNLGICADELDKEQMIDFVNSYIEGNQVCIRQLDLQRSDCDINF